MNFGYAQPNISMQPTALVQSRGTAADASRLASTLRADFGERIRSDQITVDKSPSHQQAPEKSPCGKSHQIGNEKRACVH
jgi:hypothetical protein